MEAAEERGLMVAGGEKERERAEPKGQKGEGRVLSSVPFVHKKNYTYINITACSSDFFSFPH